MWQESCIRELITEPCKKCGLLAPSDATFDGLAESFVDEQGMIKDDVACYRCHYNLRGLAHDAQCPECGNDINIETGFGQLRLADARWLGRLA